MVDPDADRIPALAFEVEGVAREAVLGEDLLAALGFPVVPERVGPVALMLRGVTAILGGRGEVTAAGDPQPLQPPADGAEAVVVPAGGELEGDAAGGPFAVPSPEVDEFEDLDRQPRGSAPRSTRVVLEGVDAVASASVNPLRER